MGGPFTVNPGELAEARPELARLAATVEQAAGQARARLAAAAEATAGQATGVAVDTFARMLALALEAGARRLEQLGARVERSADGYRDADRHAAHSAQVR